MVYFVAKVVPFVAKGGPVLMAKGGILLVAEIGILYLTIYTNTLFRCFSTSSGEKLPLLNSFINASV